MNSWGDATLRGGNANFTGDIVYPHQSVISDNAPGPSELTNPTRARVCVHLIGIPTSAGDLDLLVEGRPDSNCDWVQLQTVTGFEGFNAPPGWQVLQTTPFTLSSVIKYFTTMPQVRFRAVAVTGSTMVYRAWLLW